MVFYEKLTNVSYTHYLIVKTAYKTITHESYFVYKMVKIVY